MIPEKLNKIQQVGGIECPVAKPFKPAQILFAAAHNKIMGRHIHQLHQPPAFIDDGGPVSPGKQGGKQPLNV